MRLRVLIGAAAAALVVVAVLAVGGDGSGQQPAGGGATTLGTLADPDADGFLEPGPGEPLRDRGEPRPAAARRADTEGSGPATAGGGAVLATFAQISDAHVRDEESPARAAFLDRYGRPFESTFRPQEALIPHVLAATVRALNAERPQAVVETGDLVDSVQANEFDQALAILDGGRVESDSGAAGYAGVQQGDEPDPLYYRPDVDPPRHPGMLDRAQEPFLSPGLRAPWYPVLGNHDLLVAGEVRPSPALESIATGDELVTALPPDYQLPRGVSPGAAVQSLLATGVPGHRRRVPRDPARRHLRASEVLDRLARSGAAPQARRAAAAAARAAVPAGGAPETNGAWLDYAFDIGPHVRAVVIDTVPREGTATLEPGSAAAGSNAGATSAASGPRVSTAQLAWLREQVAAAGDRSVVVFAHATPPEDAMRVLDHAGSVIALITGNSHRNRIVQRGRYWLITTSSLADHPQQARMFRLLRTPSGLALETWMVDHDGQGLAGTARELAYLDAQGGRPQGFAGTLLDRNVRLHLPAATPTR